MSNSQDEKLFFVTCSRIPSETAESIAIIKNCEALQSIGFSIEIISPKRKNILENTSMKEYYSIKSNIPLKKLFSLSFLHLFKNSRLQWLSFLLLTFTFAYSASKYIKNSNVKKKIIFVREPDLLKFILFFLKKQNISIIFEMHQLSKLDSQEISCLKKLGAIITISKYQKNKLKEAGMYSEKIFYLPSGFDKELFENSSPKIKKNILLKLDIGKDSKILMYAGSLAQWKEVDFIIKALKAVRRKIFLIIIGGTDSEIKTIQKKFDESYLKNVKFMGRLLHKEVPKYLSVADILIQYSLPFEHNKLTSFSPLKLMEYMAMGKAILASDLPWIREIIDDQKNGILFDPTSEEDLGEKINYLMENESLLDKLGNDAKIHSTKFSYSERAKILKKIINSI